MSVWGGGEGGGGSRLGGLPGGARYLGKLTLEEVARGGLRCDAEYVLQRSLCHRGEPKAQVLVNYTVCECVCVSVCVCVCVCVFQLLTRSMCFSAPSAAAVRHTRSRRGGGLWWRVCLRCRWLADCAQRVNCLFKSMCQYVLQEAVTFFFCEAGG
jgi:hypothetical protein